MWKSNPPFCLLLLTLPLKGFLLILQPLDYPEGTYIVAMKGHVVAVVDGNYIDTWDSGKANPLYFWRKDD